MRGRTGSATSGGRVHPAQLPCYLTWAGAEVKEIIQRHLRESALYGGAISGRGPRYCPSVEDKVVRFPDAVRHQVFLEPEGLETDELYVNGLSTSLPAAVQLAFLRAVPGLEAVEMTRPGYAIEYDYFPPTQLHPTLESRALPGLFFAGQVNGTTGYEEAAGQGALAGLNAALLRSRGGAGRALAGSGDDRRAWWTTWSTEGSMNPTGSSPAGPSSGSCSGRTTHFVGSCLWPVGLGFLTRPRSAPPRLDSRQKTPPTERRGAPHSLRSR